MSGPTSGFSWRARLSVMVERDGEEAEAPLGAAFLVGSRHVVTCAHNLEGLGEETDVHVCFPLPGRNGVHRFARIAVRANWRGGEPDVAVLELDEDTDIRPALLASPHALLPPGVGPAAGATGTGHGRIEVAALGFPTSEAGGTSPDDRSPELVFNDHDGTVLDLFTRQDRHLTQDRWQVTLASDDPGTISHGYSGAGAYLTGAWWRGWEEDDRHVVGMISTGDRRVRGRSGTMIPLSAIGRVWEEIDDHIDLGWFTPDARRRLRRIVTGLGDEVDFRGVHGLCFPHFQHDPVDVAPATPWQWVRHTAEKGLSGDREGDLGAFLRRVHASLPPDRGDGLRTWLEEYCGTGSADPEAPSYVTVTAHRLLYDDTYTVTLRREDEGVPGASLELAEVPEDELRDSVEPRLNALLLGYDRHDANTLFEFVVPVPLFHTGFELWNLTSFQQITDRYPVVVSASELHMTLFQGAEPSSDDAGNAFHRNAALRERWNVLQTRGKAGAQVLACVGTTDRVTTKRRLNARADRQALVHSTLARIPQIEGALDAGVPIMLLPRRACDHDDHGDCSGARRAGQLKRLVEGTPFDKLADRVRHVRRQALGEEGEDHCGHKLSLIVNDPGRIGRNTEPPMYMGSEDPV
ncbi:hypothetical protein [Nocardiopsis synnemataformans]|uniref:VMAP-C domain-containing protein n=1 Tax=Nocardiopsis synnemataformans TaxID=61305 RepID=UPI003EB722D5